MKIFSVFKSRLFSNSLWMISEKIISIFGLIFVTSFVAKYIGPENFGKLTLAISLFAVIQTIAMFGSENVIFQKTSKNFKTGIKLILAARKIRNTLYFIFGPILLAYLYYSVDMLTFVFAVASCIATFFALHDVFNIYFNAVLDSKINALCNVVGMVVSLVIRYLIVILSLDVSYLAIPIIVVSLLPFILRRYIFNKIIKDKKININQDLNKYTCYMVGVGRKLVLYSLSVAIFTKTSQIFLGWHSTYDLGIYTVAVTLGTSFYFVLLALITSFMTDIYKENSYNESQKKVARLNLMVLIISFFAFVFFYIFGNYIINMLYGEKFRSAISILLLMVIVCMFSGLSTVAEKYLIKFNAYSYLQKKTNILVIFNIIITFFSVKYFGLYGAVFSILLTELFSTTLFNYFYGNKVIIDTHKRIFLLSTYR